MILTLKELAEYLKISERSVQRMVKSGQIHGSKLGGQYRFNGSEIDRIFFQDKGASEDYVPLSELTHTMFEIPISRLITENRVVLDMKATCMAEAIEELTPPDVFNNLVLDINELRSKCLEREKLLNTGVGKGLAIPHPRDPVTSLRAPGCVVIGISKKGVDYSAKFKNIKEGLPDIVSSPVDGEPIRLFFFICAQNIELHLHLMGKIATLARDKAFIDSCNNASTAQDIIRAVMTHERNNILQTQA